MKITPTFSPLPPGTRVYFSPADRDSLEWFYAFRGDFSPPVVSPFDLSGEVLEDAGEYLLVRWDGAPYGSPGTRYADVAGTVARRADVRPS